LIRRLREGLNMALVSEAGTPLLSDPGYRLVQLAIAAGLRVVPIPGPAAVITALAVAGLPMERFVFEGFLPKKPGKRRKRLENLGTEPRTLIFYESPRRLSAVLGDMLALWGDRRVVVARELTKKFEEILRGRLTAVRDHLEQHPPQGEVTLVVEGTDSAAQLAMSREADDPIDLC
jgi:16S rRNA (cytidine1402-2'-O)-methyltransferase